MASAEPHNFDRRATDANVASLSIRVAGLESRMELVEREQRVHSRELLANTALTKQVHTMAEALAQDTKQIISAVTWLSTTKKIVIALVAGVGGVATAGAAVVGFAKLVGWMA